MPLFISTKVMSHTFSNLELKSEAAVIALSYTRRITSFCFLRDLETYLIEGLLALLSPKCVHNGALHPPT